ncbi:MAG TPA: SBBP repeat-containing protein, partial [Isosphaeraceae bacterium]|nr:SBBP repeat-containing protein [Isosphaeraceae bacterium]
MIEALEERATPTGGFGYAFGLGGAGGDTVNRVVADSLGNVYVAGSFSSTVDIDPGPEVFNLTNTGGTDGFLAKYAPDGSLVWADQIPDTTPTNFSRFALAIDTGGGIYLTGGQAGSAFVSKYTESGDLAWTRTLGGSGTASGTGIAVDATGNVFTTGVYSGGTIDLDPGSGTFIKSADGTSPNSYISKLDSSGNFVWGGAFEGQPMTSSWIIAGDMVMDQEENLYITGTFVGTVDFEPGSGTVLKTASSTN